MSKVYCGAKNQNPKGTKKGTLKECKKSRQVRLWGVEKVDIVDDKEVQSLVKNKKKREAYIKKITNKRGEINKVDLKIRGMMDDVKLKRPISDVALQELINERSKLYSEYEKLIMTYKKVEEVLKKKEAEKKPQGNKKKPAAKKQASKFSKEIEDEAKKVVKSDKAQKDFIKLYSRKKGDLNKINMHVKDLKERDQPVPKEVLNDQKKLSKEFEKLDLIFKRAKELNKKKGKGVVIKGGKISAKLLKVLFEKDDFEDVGLYKMDKDLSTKWVRVLHNPQINHTIVVHRGSDDLYDAWIDAQLAIGYKNNKRFKESKKIQEAAEKKYGTDHMSVIGSSLGGTLAEDFGKNASEIITSGKPVTPLDLLIGKKPHETQHDVRTHTDIISFLKPFQKHENDILVKSVDPKNPVKSHLGKHTMDAVMDKYGEDVEIGEEGVGDVKEGSGSIPNFKKMKVVELRNFIKQNRKAKKLKASAFKVSGKKKCHLVAMATSLYNL
jgi:hypothetical protein